MFLVLDGHNLAWAGFHALRQPMGATTPDELERVALAGLAQAVFGLAVRAGEPPGSGPGPAPAGIAVVFDQGQPHRRRALFPPYQAARGENEAFMANLPFVQAGIERFIVGAAWMPIEVLRGPDCEADDLAAALVLAGHEGTARIASSDRDFLQLVDERVSVYAPLKKLVIDPHNFESAVAPRDGAGAAIPFPRERYLDYRVLSGDASDGIPGVPGVGTATAARLLARAPLEAYFEDPGRVAGALGRRSRRVESAFASDEGRAVVQRNRLLMDLRLAAAQAGDLGRHTTRGAWDERAFRAWVRHERIPGADVEATCQTFAATASCA